MNVMFNPFTDEVNIVVDHLIENDMRSDNTFLEKAQAVHTIMVWIQGEKPDQVISQRQWVEMLKERHGYTVSKSALRRYLYALEKLYPFLPQALEAGMSLRQADEIHKLETRVRKYAEALEVVESRMDLAFQQALLACDTSDGFAVAAVEAELCSQLAMMTGVTPDDFETGLIRFESGVTDIRPRPAGRSAAELVVSNGQPTVPSIHAAPDRLPSVRTAEVQEERDWGDPLRGHPDVRPPEPSGISALEPPTLHQQRETAFKHAQSIAKTVMIRDCIKPLAAGYGFYVEVPTTTLIHPDETIQRHVIWWFLSAISATYDEGGRFHLFDDDSVLKQNASKPEISTTEDFFSLIDSLVGNAKSTYRGVWITITDPAFPIDDFSSLIQIIQHLRQNHTSDELWTAG